MDKEKKSIGDYLSGALEAAGVSVGYVPQALGSAILAGGEGLLSGFDWSDRPSWLFPAYDRKDIGRKTSLNEGVDGMPFWNSEEAKQGFVEGIQRYSAEPMTEEGRAAAEGWNNILGLVDLPFAQFGEGSEELAKRLGASDEVADTIGDIAYWGTSVGYSPIKGALSYAKRGMGTLADKSQILRKGWYKQVPGFQRNPVAVINTPVEMAREGFWQSLSPVEKAQYRERGVSRMSQEAIDDNLELIRKFQNTDKDSWVSSRTKDYLGQDIPKEVAQKRAMDDWNSEKLRVNKAKREIVSDYSNQYVQKAIFDPDNPAIQPGSPLERVNSIIFPSKKTTTATEMKSNPQVISEALNLDLNPAVAKHLSERIPERFTRINDGKPVVLAHRREGADVTGNQMGQMVASYKTNPKNGIGHAWSNLMERKEPVTAESLMAEIKRLNDTKGYDRKSPYPLPRKIKEEDGYISYEFQVDAGPDPLTASVDVIGVFNRRTGRITELSIDRMALGGGLGKVIDDVAEAGAKQHWISITPWQTSIPGKYLSKHGLDNESLIALDAGVRGAESANFPKGMTNAKGKATPKGRQAVNQSIENLGETMMSGEMPMVPKASDVVGMMPQAPLPFGILPTGRPKIGLEDFFPQLNPPLAALGQQERYKRDN